MMRRTLTCWKTDLWINCMRNSPKALFSNKMGHHLTGDLELGCIWTTLFLANELDAPDELIACSCDSNLGYRSYSTRLFLLGVCEKIGVRTNTSSSQRRRWPESSNNRSLGNYQQCYARLRLARNKLSFECMPCNPRHTHWTFQQSIINLGL